MTTEEIRRRIADKMGISELLPMQREMENIKLPSRTLLCAPTGSGKTLAFAIGVLRSLPKTASDAVEALIIAPTRELVLQITEILRTLAAPEFKTVALYGGHSYSTEAASLEGKPNIVVGTPGRLLDHIQRGRLGLYECRTLVIDEYDKSLELGFADDMQSIIGRLKNARTLILTSATEGEIPGFIGKVDRKLNFTAADNRPDVENFEVASPTPDKLDTLGQLLTALGDTRTIVFVNHRDAAERVFAYLEKAGFPAILYHGGLEQNIRRRALILFENGTCPIMVSTDLGARGLDIDAVGAVVHYHLANSAEAYTHRNGRTARMGASGKAYSIISEHDKRPEFLADLKPLEHPLPEQVKGTPSGIATLYLNAGKKEKISRGDIAGFLIQKGGLTREEVGRIDVDDHCAYVAVPADKARATAAAVAPYKIKNTRVRVTQLKDKLG